MLFPGRRATIAMPALALAALAALAAGCGGNTQPRSLSSGSPSPSTPATATSSPSTSPTASSTPTTTGSAAVKKQLDATVRKYYDILNGLKSNMDADALAALFTKDCKCQKQVRSIRSVKADGNHYTQTYTIKNLAPGVSDSNHGTVLVTLSETAGGIANANGKLLQRSSARKNYLRDFHLVKMGQGWLIDEIAVVE
jgi:ABC-type phosphate transport system substrate-binding protein